MKKKIKDYTHSELLELTNDELSKLLDIEMNDSEAKRNEFEKKEYPNFSFNEKVKYWSGVLYRQMRWQVESGLDPYAIYDSKWHEIIKQEPEIDKIMDCVFDEYWKGEWDKSEFIKRIKLNNYNDKG